MSKLKFIITISIVLIFLTSVPYLYGRWFAPHDFTTIGLGYYNQNDNPVYYGYIEQIKQGHWLFQDLYTTEKQTSFLNIFWLAVGLLAKIFNFSSITAFHLARILLIPCLVLAVVNFLKLFIKNDFKLKIATIFLIFVSGSGIIFYNLIPFFGLQNKSLWDVAVPEAIIFKSAYASPHLLASWILIIVTFFFLTRYFEKNSKSDLIKSGASALLLTQFHPFYIALLIVAPTAFAAVLFLKIKKFSILKNWLLFEFFLLPSIIYYLYLQKDIIFKLRSENLMLSPPPFTLLISFGPLLVLAIIGLFLAVKKSNAWLFVAVWFLAGLFLLYAPVTYQRRLIEGWIIPLALLALLTLNELIQNEKITGLFKNRRELLTITFTIFMISILFSNPTFYFQTFDIYQTQIQQLYLPKKELLAFDWLKTQTDDNDIILANDFIDANRLPGLTGRRIFWGHMFETVNSKQKMSAIQKFLTTNDATEQYNFLKNNNINFIFWNKNSNTGFKPQQATFLKETFANELIQIYEVN